MILLGIFQEGRDTDESTARAERRALEDTPADLWLFFLFHFVAVTCLRYFYLSTSTIEPGVMRRLWPARNGDLRYRGQLRCCYSRQQVNVTTADARELFIKRHGIR